MKSAVKVLSVLLAVLFLLSGVVSVSAAEIGETVPFPVQAVDGTVTEVFFENGTSATYDGVPDAQALESWSGISSVIAYRISFGGEEVFSVTLRDIEPAGGIATSASASAEMNGYYAVSFDMPGTNREAFLTGLTPRNLDIVQRKIIKSYQYGTMFDIESIEFIDTEKTTYSPADDNLCWAAASSNILAYTGWAEYAGFDSTDELFNEFAESFKDGGGVSDSGVSWFFNGIYPMLPEMVKESPGWAIMYDEIAMGYLYEYPYDSVVTTFYFDDHVIDNMQVLMSALRSGCGIVLGVDWMFEGQRSGGHAISAWGYVVNNDYPEDDYRHYEALIISDSDSDEQPDADRRTAPNKLTVMSMTTYHMEGYMTGMDGWYFYDYNEIGGVLSDFAVVLPYGSVASELEGTPAGTFDKKISPDPGIDYISMSHFDDFGSYPTTDHTFYLGERIHIRPDIINCSYVNYEGDLRVLVTVTDESGAVCYQDDRTYEADIYPFMYLQLDTCVVEGLDKGTYTVSVQIWTQEGTEEAFYTNNTLTDTFEVSDLYDLRDLKITAEFAPVYNPIDDETGSWAGEMQFTYEGFDAIEDAIEGYTPVLENGWVSLGERWTSWRTSGTSPSTSYYTLIEEKGYVPAYQTDAPDAAPVTPFNSYGKMKYAIGVKLKGVLQPVYIYTDEYPVGSPNLVTQNSLATGVIRDGELQMEDDERFFVEWTNIPYGDSGSFTGDYLFYTTKVAWDSPATGKDIYHYFGEKEEVTIAPDDTYSKTFDTLPADLMENPASTYFGIYLCGSFENGIQIKEHIPLGGLKKPETPSLVVTTNTDTDDDSDGLITLREAIQYSHELDDSAEKVITFDLDEPIVFLYNTLWIDDDITIDGVNSDGRDVKISGLTLQNSTMLDISGLGKVSLRHLIFQNGSDDESLIFLREEVDAVFTDCAFRNNIVDRKGIVYAYGDCKVSFNRCTAANSFAATGAFLYIEDGVQAEMLNCTIDNNRSRNGVVYNYAATLNMVNCTLYGNGVTLIADSAVMSEGETNLLNCIVVGNGLRNRLTRVVSDARDISDEMNVYGSLIGGAIADPDVFNDSSIDVETSDIFSLEESSVVKQITIGENGMPDLLPSAADGYRVTVVDGMLAYAAKGGEQPIVTDIPAAFDAKEYSVDAVGLKRSYAYGSMEPFSTRLRGDADGDGSVDIIDATLIQRHLVGFRRLSPAAQLLADANGDGELDIDDATLIQRYDVGIKVPGDIGLPLGN